MTIFVEDLVDDLLELDGKQLLSAWAGFDVAHRRELWTPMQDRLGPAAHQLFLTDPAGWIEVALGEGIWSKQVEICAAIAKPHATVAVPACHAPGKSHLGARIAGWWGSSFPPDLARGVVTATNWTHVEKIFFAYLSQVHTRHHLPGEVLSVKWKLAGQTIMWGFSVAKGDDVGAQGVHAPFLLIIIDEAGGVEQAVGESLEGLKSAGDVRTLILGNPPPDRQDTWFERQCSSPHVTTIEIPAAATPNFTGEETDWCRCPNPLPHRIASHLVRRDWVEKLVEEYGAESPIVRAKVHAKFPTGSRLAVIGTDVWEACADDRTAGFDPPRSWIGVGVDVAAGGGDELVVVAWRPDGRLTIDLTDNSEKLRDPAVAGELVVSTLERIQASEVMAILEDDPDLGPSDVYLPLWVKFDADGVGWGLELPIQDAISTGRIYGEVIPVRSGRRATERTTFANRRAEMWWQARKAVQEHLVKLPADRRLKVQATRVEYRMSAGLIQVETKEQMRKRFGSSAGASPDRADAMCLAIDTMEMPILDGADHIDPFASI